LCFDRALRLWRRLLKLPTRPQEGNLAHARPTESDAAFVAPRPAQAVMASSAEEGGDAVAASPADGDAQSATLGGGATIPIFNFEHGMRSKHVFRMGPYAIRVERDQHFDQTVFSSSGGRNYSIEVDDDAVANRVTPLTRRDGRWSETAVVVDSPSLHERSLLFPSYEFLSGKNDLGLLLWFLTGREVLVGDERPQQFVFCGSANRLVSGNYFYGPSFDWSRIPSLAASGAADALYAVCLAISAPDLMLKISAASGALDSLVSRWYRDNGAQSVSDESRGRFVTAMDAYKEKLAALGEPSDRIEDVVARIPNLLNDVSALGKLKAFLVAHSMLDSNATDAAQKRVRLLNTYRNAVAHQAKVLVNSKADTEKELRVAGAVGLVLLMICRVYIAKHLLGVSNDTYGVDVDEASVRAFFSNGRFRDHDVFNESYEDFVQRVDEAWTQRGEFPA
jgi:hypothetical protein